MPGPRKLGWVVIALVALWVVGRIGGGAPHGGTSARPAHDLPATSATTATSAAPTRTTPSVGTHGPSPAPTRPGTAAAALAGLAVKGRAPMTGYSRDQFGQAWLDADRNGCDTRNDILGRDLVDRVYKADTHGCVVLSGLLHDPYLGTEVAFERGAADQVDIDHVVALGNAWATGAGGFGIRERAALANDPLNLLAVDLHSNRSKGDGDAATWLPAYKPFRCSYVARQIAVKQKYGLWVTAPERSAMTRVLAACPGQLLPPDRTHAPTRVDQNIEPPAAASGPSGMVGSGTYYPNCAAVRAAGAAPLHVGEPGYSRRLDRDGDGVACE